MGHEWGAGFDPSVCDGCPHRIEADGKSGRSIVDAVAQAIKSTTDRGSNRCELCGCYLAGLDKAQAPPSNCVRLDQHVDQ